MVKPVKYNSFKLKIGNWVLKRNLKKVNRIVKVCSLTNAKTVGVSFIVNGESDLEEIRKILKELASRDIKTFAIGYIPVKKPDDFYLSQKGFNFFSNADLDFRLLPKSEPALEFINTEFDVLIDFGSEEYFPMDYILNMSKAGFKIGKFRDKMPFDMMLEMDLKTTKWQFFEQALVYLEKIK